MFDVSLPREDLSRRRSELFRPPRHERANSFAARRRATIRRLADLQFGSIWRDLAALLPKVRGTLVDVGSGAQPFRELLDVSVQYIAVDIVDSEPQFGYRTHGTRYYQGSRSRLI